MLLPASLDVPFRTRPLRRDRRPPRGLPRDEAIARILEMSGDRYERAPWLRELDLALWEDMNTVGVARAMRGDAGRLDLDRELLRKVETPVLLICREGDSIHPPSSADPRRPVPPRS